MTKYCPTEGITGHMQLHSDDSFLVAVAAVRPPGAGVSGHTSARRLRWRYSVQPHRRKKGEGSAAVAAPVVPKNATVVRDGKARLLVNSKSFEIALERLGQDEQKFIEETRSA